ncbi:hypothetical protein HDV01_003230 [Terramyces sp. JEL0728]|nr:hypothetical protein HDV01_003230 [Terramyces sp. JEL0728]
MVIDSPLPLDIDFPIQIKVAHQVFKITPELYKKIPKDSSLFAIIDPYSSFTLNKDTDGNIVLLNNQVPPHIFQLILDYIQTGSVADLLINTTLERPQLISALEYFCIDLPPEFSHERSINQALINGAQVRARNHQYFIQKLDHVFDTLIKDFLPLACKISNILINDFNRYFLLERRANEEAYSDNNVSFSLNNTGKQVSVRMDYKGIQVKFSDAFESPVTGNTLAALGFTLLSALWGLGYSKDEMRVLCFGCTDEFSTKFRGRFLEP